MIFTDLKKLIKMFDVLGIRYEIGTHEEIKDGEVFNYRHVRIFTRQKKAYLEFNFQPQSEKYLNSQEMYIDNFKTGKRVLLDNITISGPTEVGNPSKDRFGF